MASDLTGIESRLARVEEALAGIEDRLRALEAARPPAAEPGAMDQDVVPAAPETPGVPGLVDLPLVLSLAGRTLMVFGGAFLLRALTDSGWVPLGGGIAIGLAYAVLWLVAADRAAGRGHRPSALFHGATGVAIACPLLWEASTRFAGIGPPAGAAALAAVTGLALAVAWRRSLQALAGVTTMAAIATSIGLVTTGQFVPVTVFLVVLGVATLWLGYDRDWFWLRWPAAFAADAAVIGLTTRAMSPQHLERPETVVAVQVLLLAAYLGSFALRTLVRGRLVIPFEIVQTVAVLGVGLGGAVAVAHAAGTGEGLLGGASALLGAGSYAAAFAFVGRRQGLGDNFYFYATLALVLTLTGCGVVLAGLSSVLVLASMSVAAAWLGRRLARHALVVHSAVYAVAAAGVSGLLALAAAALVRAPATWPAFEAGAWVALAAAALCLATPCHEDGEADAVHTRIPRLVLSSLVVLGVWAAVVLHAAPVVAGDPPDAGTLATLRTAVIAGTALVLAGATRVARARELGWLLYPVLVLGSVKLLVEDMRVSRPASLFVALALFGAALVVAPRLARREHHASGR
jgi:hypothetical protein